MSIFNAASPRINQINQSAAGSDYQLCFAQVMTLTPSFKRLLAHMVPLLLLITAIGAVIEYARTGEWWSLMYLATLLIPFSVLIIFVWLALVPCSVELTDNELTINRWGGRYVSISLADLQYYMQGPTTFMIQRNGESAYQVYPGAFDADRWQAFINALEKRFPEKKASFYIGTTLHG
ncbi:MAG TPA: hypothetical protein VH170_03825 [Chthoniobacterales bacterium]|nr:hypothetical protein [Chthoniobacterales bacterium]